MSRLAPLSEEPTISNDRDDSTHSSRKKSLQKTWRNWLRNHFSVLFNKKSDLRTLLSVLGCPLFPVSVHPDQSVNRVSSSAQYIIQHYTAATACRKLEGMVKNIYATGKVTMAMLDEHPSTVSTAGPCVFPQRGCFVMWQMVPNKWLVELVVGGQKIIAGSDGNVAWRHTPWLGAHTAKGGVRPLRRSIQGLDPMTVSVVFSMAEFIGEKQILDVDCFVLKLSANDADLAGRGDNAADMIKHVIFGYFSQRSGFLIYLEDSYLTRIQYPGSPTTYWETTMATRIEDYRPVEDVMIAHSGHTNATITRFGENMRAGPAITRMEESWVIDDLAFNVPGLSMDSFIPPEEVQKPNPQENSELRSPLHR